MSEVEVNRLQLLVQKCMGDSLPVTKMQEIYCSSQERCVSSP